MLWSLPIQSQDIFWLFYEKYILYKIQLWVFLFQHCSETGQDWGQKGSPVSGQCGLGIGASRMRNWIFLSCVFSSGTGSGSATGLLTGESLGSRRRGKAAHYWNLTDSTHNTRATREADRSLGQSFPVALPAGSIFSVSVSLSKSDFIICFSFSLRSR